MGLYRDNTGTVVEVDDDYARTHGYTPVSTREVVSTAQQEARTADRGLAGDLAAASTGVASALTLGASDVALANLASPLTRERLAADIEASPIARAGGEFTGALAGGLAAPGSLLARTPGGAFSQAAARQVEAGLAAGGVSGTARALGAMGAEGAAQSFGQYIGMSAIQDTEVTAEGAAGALGTGFGFGAAAGGALLGIQKGTIATRKLWSRTMDGGEQALDDAARAWETQQQQMLEAATANFEIARARLDEIRSAKLEAQIAKERAKAFELRERAFADTATPRVFEPERPVPMDGPRSGHTQVIHGGQLDPLALPAQTDEFVDPQFAPGRGRIEYRGGEPVQVRGGDTQVIPGGTLDAADPNATMVIPDMMRQPIAPPGVADEIVPLDEDLLFQARIRYGGDVSAVPPRHPRVLDPSIGDDLAAGVADAAQQAPKTFAEAIELAGQRAARFGDRKAFISSVYENMDPKFRGDSLDDFKDKLFQAHKKGDISLARADLVQAMDPGLVTPSRLDKDGATFHFINVKPAPEPFAPRTAEAPRAAEPPKPAAAADDVLDEKAFFDSIPPEARNARFSFAPWEEAPWERAWRESKDLLGDDVARREAELLEALDDFERASAKLKAPDIFADTPAARAAAQEGIPRPAVPAEFLEKDIGRPVSATVAARALAMDEGRLARAADGTNVIKKGAKARASDAPAPRHVPASDEFARLNDLLEDVRAPSVEGPAGFPKIKPPPRNEFAPGARPPTQVGPSYMELEAMGLAGPKVDTRPALQKYYDDLVIREYEDALANPGKLSDADLAALKQERDAAVARSASLDPDEIAAGRRELLGDRLDDADLDARFADLEIDNMLEDISRHVEAIADYERSSAKLAKALGDDAHPVSRQLAEQLEKAESEAMRKFTDRQIRALEDAETFGPWEQNGPAYLSPKERVKWAKARTSEAEAEFAELKMRETEAKRDHDVAKRTLDERKKAFGKPDTDDTPAPKGRLGKAADVAAAVEMVGMPGMPKASDIPVIGPLLGAYLKFRGVKAIMSRMSGRVPATGDTKMAALAAQTKERIAKSIDRALNIAEKGTDIGTKHAGKLAGVLAARVYDDGEPDAPKGAGLPELAATRMREISAYVSTPGAIERDVRRELAGVSDPDLIAAVEKHRRAMFEYLLGQMPKIPEQSPLNKAPWRPSPAEAASFARRLEAANDPAGVWERVAHEQAMITLEAAQTLRAVYPSLFGLAQRRLLEQATRVQQTVPYQTRLKMSLLYDVPLDGPVARIHTIQTAFAGSAAPAPGGPAPGQPPTPAIANPTNLTSLYQTTADRRATR